MVKLFSKNSNLCDHNPPTLQTDRQTDRETDRQTTCDRNTALCTKFHHAVKTRPGMSKQMQFYCFSRFLKVSRNGAEATSAGRSFHVRALATREA